MLLGALRQPLDLQLLGSLQEGWQLLLGHVPVLLHPNPRTVLVIGFGAGVTLGSVAAHEGIEELTLVEIEPAVLAAGSLVAHVNEGCLPSYLPTVAKP